MPWPATTPCASRRLQHAPCRKSTKPQHLQGWGGRAIHRVQQRGYHGRLRLEAHQACKPVSNINLGFTPPLRNTTGHLHTRTPLRATSLAAELQQRASKAWKKTHAPPSCQKTSRRLPWQQKDLAGAHSVEYQGLQRQCSAAYKPCAAANTTQPQSSAAQKHRFSDTKIAIFCHGFATGAKKIR